MTNPMKLKPCGSHLADLRLTRLVDGTFELSVIEMHPRLIETTGAEVPDRLRIIAGWVMDAAPRMAEAFNA